MKTEQRGMHLTLAKQVFTGEQSHVLIFLQRSNPLKQLLYTSLLKSTGTNCVGLNLDHEKTAESQAYLRPTSHWLLQVIPIATMIVTCMNMKV